MLRDVITQASNNTGLPVAFIEAQIQKESNWDPNAVSNAGAIGLMQIVPKWHPEYTGGFDSEENVKYGTAYQAKLFDMFDGDAESAIAAYNWGPGNVRKVQAEHGSQWKEHLPDETKDYVATLVPAYEAAVQNNETREPGIPKPVWSTEEKETRVAGIPKPVWSVGEEASTEGRKPGIPKPVWKVEGSYIPAAKDSGIVSRPGTLSRSLSRGTEQTQGLIGEFVREMGDTTGFASLVDVGDEMIRNASIEAITNPAQIESWEDVRFHNLGAWVLQNVGEQALNTGIAAAMALITRGTSIPGSISAAFARAGVGKAAANAVGKQALLSANQRMALGAGLGILPINTGEIIGEQREAGLNPGLFSSLALGAGTTALDVVGIALFAGPLLKGYSPEVAGSAINLFMRRFGHASVQGLVGEFGTEGAQEAMVIASQKLKDPTFDVAEAILSDEGRKRIFAAAMAGGTVGFAFGGTGATVRGGVDAVRNRFQTADLRAKTEPLASNWGRATEENSFFDFEKARTAVYEELKGVRERGNEVLAALKVKLDPSAQTTKDAAVTATAAEVAEAEEFLTGELNNLQKAEEFLDTLKTNTANTLVAIQNILNQIPKATGNRNKKDNASVEKFQKETEAMLDEWNSLKNKPREQAEMIPKMIKLAEKIAAQGLKSANSIKKKYVQDLMKAVAETTTNFGKNREKSLKKYRTVLNAMTNSIKKIRAKLPEVQTTQEQTQTAEGRPQMPVEDTLAKMEAVANGTDNAAFWEGTKVPPLTVRKKAGELGLKQTRTDTGFVFTRENDNVQEAINSEFPNGLPEGPSVAVTAKDKKGRTKVSEAVEATPEAVEEAVTRRSSKTVRELTAEYKRLQAEKKSRLERLKMTDEELSAQAEERGLSVQEYRQLLSDNLNRNEPRLRELRQILAQPETQKQRAEEKKRASNIKFKDDEPVDVEVEPTSRAVAKQALRRLGELKEQLKLGLKANHTIRVYDSNGNLLDTVLVTAEEVDESIQEIYDSSPNVFITSNNEVLHNHLLKTDPVYKEIWKNRRHVYTSVRDGKPVVSPGDPDAGIVGWETEMRRLMALKNWDPERYAQLAINQPIIEDQARMFQDQLNKELSGQAGLPSESLFSQLTPRPVVLWGVTKQEDGKPAANIVQVSKNENGEWKTATGRDMYIFDKDELSKLKRKLNQEKKFNRYGDKAPTQEEIEANPELESIGGWEVSIEEAEPGVYVIAQSIHGMKNPGIDEHVVFQQVKKVLERGDMEDHEDEFRITATDPAGNQVRLHLGEVTTLGSLQRHNTYNVIGKKAYEAYEDFLYGLTTFINLGYKIRGVSDKKGKGTADARFLSVFGEKEVWGRITLNELRRAQAKSLAALELLIEDSTLTVPEAGMRGVMDIFRFRKDGSVRLVDVVEALIDAVIYSTTGESPLTAGARKQVIKVRKFAVDLETGRMTEGKPKKIAQYEIGDYIIEETPGSFRVKKGRHILSELPKTVVPERQLIYLSDGSRVQMPPNTPKAVSQAFRKSVVLQGMPDNELMSTLVSLYGLEDHSLTTVIETSASTTESIERRTKYKEPNLTPEEAAIYEEYRQSTGPVLTDLTAELDETTELDFAERTRTRFDDEASRDKPFHQRVKEPQVDKQAGNVNPFFRRFFPNHDRLSEATPTGDLQVGDLTTGWGKLNLAKAVDKVLKQLNIKEKVIIFDEKSRGKVLTDLRKMAADKRLPKDVRQVAQSHADTIASQAKKKKQAAWVYTPFKKDGGIISPSHRVILIYSPSKTKGSGGSRGWQLAHEIGHITQYVYVNEMPKDLQSLLYDGLNDGVEYNKQRELYANFMAAEIVRTNPELNTKDAELSKAIRKIRAAVEKVYNWAKETFGIASLPKEHRTFHGWISALNTHIATQTARAPPKTVFNPLTEQFLKGLQDNNAGPIIRNPNLTLDTDNFPTSTLAKILAPFEVTKTDVGLPLPQEATEGICDGTCGIVTGRLKKEGFAYGKGNMQAKSPLGDWLIWHKVALTRINGELYIINQPQGEFMGTDFNIDNVWEPIRHWRNDKIKDAVPGDMKGHHDFAEVPLYEMLTGKENIIETEFGTTDVNQVENIRTYTENGKTWHEANFIADKKAKIRWKDGFEDIMFKSSRAPAVFTNQNFTPRLIKVDAKTLAETYGTDIETAKQNVEQLNKERLEDGKDLPDNFPLRVAPRKPRRVTVEDRSILQQLVDNVRRIIKSQDPNYAVPVIPGTEKPLKTGVNVITFKSPWREGGSTVTMEIWKNPTRYQLRRWTRRMGQRTMFNRMALDEDMYDHVRFISDIHGDLYVWDAFSALHDDIIDATGMMRSDQVQGDDGQSAAKLHDWLKRGILHDAVWFASTTYDGTNSWVPPGIIIDEIAADLRAKPPFVDVMDGFDAMEDTAAERSEDSAFRNYWEDFQKFGNRFIDNPLDALKSVVWTADGELRSMGGFGLWLAREFHVRPGEVGVNPKTVMREIMQEGAVWHSELHKILEKVPGSRTSLAENAARRLRKGKQVDKTQDQIDRHEIMIALQKSTPIDEVRPDLQPHVEAIRDYLNRMYKWYRKDMGLDLKFLENYYPLMLDAIIMEARRDEFVQILVNKGGFSIAEANEIRARITRDSNGGLNLGYQDQISEDFNFQGPGASFKRHRASDYRSKRDKKKVGEPEGNWNDDVREALIDAGFYQQDMATTLIAYTDMVVRRAVWEKRYNAGTLDEVTMADYERLEINPNAPIAGLQYKIKKALENGQINQTQYDRIVEDILPAYSGQLGLRVNSKVRRLNAALVIYQNIRLLGFALLSSIVDVGTVFTRGDMESNFAAIKAMMDKQSRAELRASLEELGALRLDLTEHVLNDQALNTFMTGNAKRINDLFFRYNMMEGWTNMMRAMAFASGRRFIIKHANLARKGNKTSQRYMDELGLGEELDLREAAAWDGAVSQASERLKAAVNRYIDESMIRPDASIRPVWMSDPGYAMFSHLKGFLYGFQATYLQRVFKDAVPNFKRIVGDPSKDNMALMVHQNLLPLLMLGMLALPFAALGYELRRYITNFGKPTTGPEGFDYFQELVERSGMPGAFQMVVDMEQADQYGKPFLLGVAGPSVEHLYDTITKDVDYTISRSIPLVAQSPPLQRWIRDVIP